MHDDIFPDRLLAGKFQMDIPPKVHAEYIAFHKKVDTTGGGASAMSFGKTLESKTASIKKKKEAMLVLAHRGSVEVYNILKKYAEKPDKRLEAWGMLALNECRMFLEGDIREEPVGMILTGAGGDGKRLRYYFAVSPPEGKRWVPRERGLIQNKFTEIAEEMDSQMEQVKFGNGYALVSVLVSADTAVGDLIEEGIQACNASGKILRFHYFTTNTGEPTVADIAEYLDGLE